MNWVHEIVEAYNESEAPGRYYYWSALAAISAVLKKNVYVERYHYILYPNIYVFIIGKSGTKKGIPLTLCKDLVEKSECTKVISGRNSIPRVIQDLGKMTSNENGTVSKKAQAIIISGELASFLVKDIDGLKILTDLYNTHEHKKKWENSLKGTGVDILLEPCISLIGATNDDHFAETVPKSDVKGGFIARTFIVYSTDRGRPNSLVYAPKKVPDINTFIPYIKELGKLKGEFKWTKETGEYYHEWYTEFMKCPPEDATGTYNRIGDGIIKVAMLLSLAKRPVLEMDLDCLQEAKAECLQCAKGANQISMGGVSSSAVQTRIVMQALLSHPDHKLSRRQLLRKFWGDIDSFTIDIVAETLLGAGVIDILNNGPERYYIMKDVVVKEYLEYERRVKS